MKYKGFVLWGVLAALTAHTTYCQVVAVDGPSIQHTVLWPAIASLQLLLVTYASLRTTGTT